MVIYVCQLSLDGLMMMLVEVETSQPPSSASDYVVSQLTHLYYCVIAIFISGAFLPDSR